MDARDRPKPVLVIGTSGSSSIYKICNLIRLCRKRTEIHVSMTQAAQEFVGSRLFEVLTGNPVLVDLFGDYPSSHPHATLARKVTVFLLAPATADLIGKVAGGIATDAVSTLALSITPRVAPCFIAPAMMPNMFDHSGVQRNLRQLEAWGYSIIPPGEGLLADGMRGKGRLAEPESILDQIKPMLFRDSAAEVAPRDRGTIESSPAFHLLREAVALSNAMAQAKENQIPDLGPTDELYGRRSNITSRAMLTLLNNLHQLAGEQHGIELLPRDASSGFREEVRTFSTVRDLIAFIEARLQEGSTPSK